jgi:Mg2+/Co2+ transporter CorB
MLRQVRVSAEDADRHSLSVEELRTVVGEVGAMIPQRHQRLLLSILELEKGTVEDIMVPRSEVVGLDMTLPWPLLVEQMLSSAHTRLPVYSGSIDELRGVLHLRKALRLLDRDHPQPEALLALVREPYYIPEGTPLNQQLLNFQNQKRRIGFVVDEYGDIQGLVTIEDLLEEIVGELSVDPKTRLRDIQADPDGAYRIAGSATLRSLNRALGWKLPTQGPRTLNGLLLEKLGQLPEPGHQVEIGGYRFEIAETRAHTVKAARVRPPTAPHRVAA